MDEEAKKTALRMIPYRLYVLGSIDGEELSAGSLEARLR